MPENPLISEIWTTKVYYRDSSGPYKVRPVLVVNHDEGSGQFTIQEITSVPPGKNFFGTFKEPIIQWLSCGLKEQSYVKCYPSNTHLVERVALHEKIGLMDEEDFINIVHKILDSKAIAVATKKV
ncbi:hypothetical protein [Paenibacillus apiarius]|uniref:hypothetical protein n=1 Tax=Paenibacillus apiarius TaxID=46240 RepID=UPI003B3A3977